MKILESPKMPIQSVLYCPPMLDQSNCALMQWSYLDVLSLFCSGMGVPVDSLKSWYQSRKATVLDNDSSVSFSGHKIELGLSQSEKLDLSLRLA